MQIQAKFQLDYDAFRLAVDLELPGSGITVLFGQSGSGKTSLLRCLAGLQKASHGYLNINGSVWQDSELGLFLPTHKRPLGYVFQEANLFPHLTVKGNLQFGLKRIGRSAGSELDHILDLLGISHLLGRTPDRLSGGERQRIAIARALALNPEILLMDEPLAALDAKRKQEILPFLDRLHRELHMPVIYVTHSQQEVACLADHLVILDQGKALSSGPLTETLGRLDIALARERDASIVWQAEVAEHEEAFHLTHAAFAGGRISLPQQAAEIGTPLRIQIYARDVSLALERPGLSSILNILPATVAGIAESEAGQAVVKLTVGAEPLLAHITSKSLKLLDLRIGMPVFAQIKGTSILN